VALFSTRPKPRRLNFHCVEISSLPYNLRNVLGTLSVRSPEFCPRRFTTSSAARAKHSMEPSRQGPPNRHVCVHRPRRLEILDRRTTCVVARLSNTRARTLSTSETFHHCRNFSLRELGSEADCIRQSYHQSPHHQTSALEDQARRALRAMYRRKHA